MLKLNSNIVLDYFANVLPKKTAKLPLSELDNAVEKAVKCAQKNDKQGLQSAMELIGRLMTYRK